MERIYGAHLWSAFMERIYGAHLLIRVDQMDESPVEGSAFYFNQALCNSANFFKLFCDQTSQHE